MATILLPRHHGAMIMRANAINFTMVQAEWGALVGRSACATIPNQCKATLQRFSWLWLVRGRYITPDHTTTTRYYAVLIPHGQWVGPMRWVLWWLLQGVCFCVPRPKNKKHPFFGIIKPDGFFSCVVRFSTELVIFVCPSFVRTSLILYTS